MEKNKCGLARLAKKFTKKKIIDNIHNNSGRSSHTWVIPPQGDCPVGGDYPCGLSEVIRNM